MGGRAMSNYVPIITFNEKGYLTEDSRIAELLTNGETVIVDYETGVIRKPNGDVVLERINDEY